MWNYFFPSFRSIKTNRFEPVQHIDAEHKQDMDVKIKADTLFRMATERRLGEFEYGEVVHA